MQEQQLTREQLLEELAVLRQQVADGKRSDRERPQAEDALRQAQDVQGLLVQDYVLLTQVGRIISSTLDIEEVYQRFSDEMRKLVDFDRIAINVVDHDAGVFVFKYVAGLVQPGRGAGDIVQLQGTQTQYVLETGQPLIRTDVAASLGFSGDEAFINSGMRSAVMVPLVSKGRVIGTLSLRSRQVNRYGPREQAVLERLAEQIAPAVENAELYAQAKRTEEELTNSRKQLSAVLNTVGNGIITFDSAGTIIMVNQEAQRIWGYREEELIGRNLRILVHDEYLNRDSTDLRTYVETVVVGVLGQQLVFEGLRKDGSIFPLEARIEETQIGQSRCFTAAMSDITTRNKSEQALRESEERFRYLVESAADGFLVFDREGNLVDVNQRACELLGYTREELMELSVWDIRGDQSSPTWFELWDSLAPGAPVTVERLYRCKDGTTVPVENRIGLIDLRGEKRLFSITRDISRRKYAEQTMLDQMRVLAVAEERNRLARELHDSIAQSLYSVSLFSETARQLAQGHGEQRLDHYLTRLGQTSQQALKEMRLLVHELRPMQFEDEGLVEALRHRLDSVEKRAGIEAQLLCEGTIDLPTQKEYELYRIAQEALNNSLKHAGATAVTVRVIAEDRRILVEVVDNGKGFNPELSRSEGGMGLVNMRERAEGLGGSLEIQSQPEQGVTVKVTVEATVEAQGTP